MSKKKPEEPKSEEKVPTATFYIYSDGKNATVRKVPLKKLEEEPEDDQEDSDEPRKSA